MLIYSERLTGCNAAGSNGIGSDATMTGCNGTGSYYARHQRYYLRRFLVHYDLPYQIL